MSDISFDLTKKAEQVTFVLAKKGITNAPTMRVCAALDISGSMDDEIRDGSLQKAVDQLGGVGIKFDDNGEIDIWVFDDRADYVGVWTPDDYQTYVKSNHISARGGTAYTPFIKDINRRMFNSTSRSVPRQVEKTTSGFLGFGKKKVVETVYDTVIDHGQSSEPVLVMVITDGEPYGDTYENIRNALKESEGLPSFFTFVGVSNQGESFKTLQRLEKDCNNVGFVKLNGFNLSDEQVYEQLITDKLVDFLKKF